MKNEEEHVLGQALSLMIAEWNDVIFKTTQHGTGVNILTSVDDIQTRLEDQIVKAQAMKSSPFIRPFHKDIKDWQERLIQISETIDVWLKVQALWLYLEPIFSSEDIAKQLPEAGMLFQSVDRLWRDMMKNITNDPHVLVVTSQGNLFRNLEAINEKLEGAQKCLEAHLEQKRMHFPNFFFVSNDDLMNILREGKDPTKVQCHLKKCFEGIDRLEFDRNLDVHAVMGRDGDKIPLSTAISTSDAHGAVEKWFLQLQKGTITSVRDIMEKARDAYAIEARDEWVKEWAGQIVLDVSKMYWTSEVHDAIRKGAPKGLQDYVGTLMRQLNDIVALVRKPLSKRQITTVNALLTIDVHAKDVVQAMVERGVTSEEDFCWLSQLRYYWEENRCVVRMANTSFNYGNEYLGNTDRLVITPLTDRCYITLMGALQMNMNGSPVGPAGTGKTETCKDLAKALGVQCVVFNCSDQIDAIVCGKFFKGLVQTGGWATFDEFNRVHIEVLSTVAQQIACINQAVQSKLDKFEFEGTTVTLNPNCFICATFNPGYAGRTELPYTLKAIFRPIAMMVPDYALISEVKLYTEGFTDARKLARKLVDTFKLWASHLSSQDHYDFGMRAVKCVLVSAGACKRQFPDEDETIILLEALIKSNFAKFVPQDLPLAKSILSDIFPGVELRPKAEHSALLGAVAEVCQKNNLQNVEIFNKKITEMYDMMHLRHGFMLVGEPFGGKTSVIHTAAEAMTLLAQRGNGDYQKVTHKTINPKAITLGQLYGQFDPASQEWHDGVLSSTFREFVTSESPDHKWLILDGPIDAVWVENLNTLLDDNKLLCLANGDYIPMSKTVKIIFETQDLRVASPATVSRCGMIFVAPQDLGWRPILKSWMHSLPQALTKEHGKLLEDLFEWLVDPCLNFVRKNCKEYCTAGSTNLVRSLMNMVEMLMRNSCDGAKTAENKHMRTWLISAVMFAVPWSIGGIVDKDGRTKFDRYFRDMCQGKIVACPLPKSLGKVDVPIPEHGLVYDYFYEQKAQGTWKAWNDLIRGTQIPSNKQIHEILVQTVDTARSNYIMDLCIESQRPLLFVGPTGTGKTAYVHEKLMNGLPKDKFVTTFVHFSARTSANQIQDNIMSKLEKRRETIFGPPMGKKSVIFVDDLNMPAKEVYGAQPPIELLRQYLDHGFWYDTKSNTKMTPNDIQFISAMGPPGGGRNEISSRLLRHFNIIATNPHSDETMTRIFSTIMTTHLKEQNVAPEFLTSGNMIVQATMGVYKQAMEDLLPTPSKPHYVFNLRDCSRIIQGVCLMKKEQMENKHVMTRLWVHEVMRVIGDRLTEDKDRTWLFNLVGDLIKDQFNDSLQAVFGHLANGGQGGKVSEDDLGSLMFGAYMNPDVEPEDRVYEEVKSVDDFRTVIEQFLNKYNNTYKTPMNLVVFRYVLEHLSRISRVLRSPGGSALLVGVGGSGRQSLTRLSGFISGYFFFQPEMSESYGLNQWRDDLKILLKNVGCKARPTVLLITDTQIKDEAVLEDISNLLNGAEVPNLFEAEDHTEIIEAIRGSAQAAGAGMTEEDLLAFFLKRCKENLHIIMTFSPIGESFRQRIRLFPSLVNCCTIDWFQAWPDEALETIANKYLEDVDIKHREKKETVQICKYFHNSAANLAGRFHKEHGRKTYVTPTSYLELMSSFKRLVKEKQDETLKVKRQYDDGLQTLAALASQAGLRGKKQMLVEKLTKGMGCEKERWERASADLQQIYENLLGDVLISAGVIVYLGPFTAAFRRQCTNDWVTLCLARKIPCTSDFSLTKTLGEPIKIQEWNKAGLPRDNFSSDNGVIVANARRWPLMIDPQGQANKWIKNMEKENNLTVLKVTDKSCMRTLENCVVFGKPLLLEDVGETLSPSLESLLVKQSATNMIRLGGKDIPYNPQFRLYLTTKLSNPNYVPEVATKVSLLNFMVTPEGLEDQLLELVLAKERPELEEEWQDLTVTMANYKRQLREIEDKILHTLSASEGSILVDESVIKIYIDSSKTLSDEITKKRKIAQETEKKMMESRQGYQPFAKHASILFFAIVDMAKVDPMYQYSLQWFLNLYLKCVDDSEKSSTLDQRVRNLKEQFQYSLYGNVCRSLLSKDRLAFSFMLCANLLMAQNCLDRDEFLFFLTGGLGVANEIPNPGQSWLSNKSWKEICRLSDMKNFKGIRDSIVENTDEWQKCYSTASPHLAKLPASWHSKLNDFQRIVVLRCIRPDKVIPAVTNFVTEKLGKKFIEPPSFDLASSFADSNCASPLILIAAKGNPTNELDKFAEAKGFGGEKFKRICLGQGQGPKAERMIEAARKEGTWVLLEHCHVLVSWLPTLEKICQEITPENTHPDFRLWLTSNPSNKFPVSLLQNAIKITNEPPAGLRENLLRSYHSDPINNQTFFRGCPGKQDTFQKLLFSLCMFHAVVQERSKFGPMGFNIPYDFHESDLRISVRQLRLFVNQYDKVPFDFLRYFTGEANHGGRVTDDKDRRLLNAILADFCNPGILEDPKYKYSASGIYHVPPQGSHEDYVEFIKNLPAVEGPEVFGLHENATIFKDLRDTKLLFDTVLQCEESKFSGKSDEIVCGIAEDILKKLPNNFDVDEAMRKYPVSQSEIMNSLLVQEMQRYNNLLSVVRTSLQRLLKAIKGQVVMISEFEEIVGSLLVNKIPSSWARRSYPSTKPLGSYIDDLLVRLNFVQKWYQDGTPHVFWLPGIFNIHGFIAIIVQKYARKHKKAIDQIGFGFHDSQVMPQEQINTSPEDGVYITGLYLEGARWDRQKGVLAEQYPGILHDKMPIIWLKPALVQDIGSSKQHYLAPVYRTNERKGVLSTTGHSTNFLLMLPLPSEQSEKHWVKRGQHCSVNWMIKND